MLGPSPSIDAMGQLENDADFLREGVWWLPNEKVSDYLILTNQGDQKMPMNLSLYDASGKTYTKALSLSARAIMRLSVRQLMHEGNFSGSYGDIQVHALAHARALDTLHVIYDEDAGFSALLKMFDHDPAANLFHRDFGKKGVWTMHAPMLALSHPDPALFIPAGTVLEPKIFLRNTIAKPVSANIVFYWRSGSNTGTTSGPTISLKPYETREVKVSALPEEQSPPRDAYWASIAISTSSQPDEVVAVAASYDASLKYGAQPPFSDQLSYLWEGGEWLADASHNSLITVGNASLKPMKARFTLFYNKGAESYELEQPLEPNEQMWVDVGDLVRSGRTDTHGNVLPKSLTSGSYQFRDLTNPGVGSLFEGKVIYDLTNGHVTYGCAACCSPRTIFMTFNPFQVGLASTAYEDVSEQDSCGDPVEDVTSVFSGWNTANSFIATTTTAGLHTGRAMGSTTSNATGVVIHTNGRNGCFQENWPVQGPTKVTPSVTISGPTSMALLGLITLTATGNPTGGTYVSSSSNSNINVQTTSSSNVVNVSANSAGSSVVTVKYTQSELTVSASQTVTVQACPSTLTRAQSFTVPLAPSVPSLLTGYGIIAEMQVGPSTTNWNLTQISETISTVTNSCPANVGSCGGGPAFTVGDNDSGIDSINGVPTPAVPNAFYDNHNVTSAKNLLAVANRASCSVTCSQVYTCGGKQIGPTFSITYSLTQGTSGSTAVTNVVATKAP